jgi:hypothetical protein
MTKEHRQQLEEIVKDEISDRQGLGVESITRMWIAGGRLRVKFTFQPRNEEEMVCRAFGTEPRTYESSFARSDILLLVEKRFGNGVTV